jgi:hypothetical protein
MPQNDSPTKDSFTGNQERGNFRQNPAHFALLTLPGAVRMQPENDPADAGKDQPKPQLGNEKIVNGRTRLAFTRISCTQGFLEFS